MYWKNLVGSTLEKYTPYLQEMMDKGEHVELDNSFFPQIVELEKQCLTYGWHFQNFSIEAGEIVEDILKNNNIILKKSTYKTSTNMVTIADTKNTSYFEYNPTKLINDEEFLNILNSLSNSEIGIAFTYVQHGTIKYHIEIRAVDMNCLDISNLLTQIRDTLLKHKNNDPHLVKTKDIINELDRQLEKLEKRIKEPYTFWATVGNAIRDIFTR